MYFSMQAFIDKFRFNAKRASLVQSRIKALERMADVEEVEVGCFNHQDGKLVVKVPATHALSTPIIL